MNLPCYCGICLPWGDPDPVERVALMSVGDSSQAPSDDLSSTPPADAVAAAAAVPFDTTDEG